MIITFRESKVDKIPTLCENCQKEMYFPTGVKIPFRSGNTHCYHRFYLCRECMFKLAEKCQNATFLDEYDKDGTKNVD